MFVRFRYHVCVPFLLLFSAKIIKSKKNIWQSAAAEVIPEVLYCYQHSYEKIFICTLLCTVYRQDGFISITLTLIIIPLIRVGRILALALPPPSSPLLLPPHCLIQILRLYWNGEERLPLLSK